MVDRIVHCKKDQYDIMIDRTTKWGNPFYLRKGATQEEREECIARYERWIWTQKHLIDAIKMGELRNKIFGCWCRPKKPCHGDVLDKIDRMCAEMEELFGKEELMKMDIYHG